MKKQPVMPSAIEPGMILLATAQVGFAKDKQPMVGTAAKPLQRPTAEHIRVVRNYRDGLKQKVAYLTKWIKCAEKEFNHAD